MALTSDMSYAYISGNLKYKLCLSKIKFSDGTLSYAYTVDTPSSSSNSKTLTQGEIFEYPSQNYILTCAENLGSDYNDIGIVDFSETFSLGISLLKSFYIDMTSKTYCRDLYFDSVNLFFTFYIS